MTSCLILILDLERYRGLAIFRCPLLLNSKRCRIQFIGDDSIRYIRTCLVGDFTASIGDVSVVGGDCNTTDSVFGSICTFCLFCKAVGVRVAMRIFSRKRILFCI